MTIEELTAKSGNVAEVNAGNNIFRPLIALSIWKVVFSSSEKI